MAEFGSHQVAPEGSRPSIFEILAQDSFSSNLRDAFRHLCKILAENFPEKCGYLQQHFEELYTLMDFIFQFVHLRIHGSFFSERFYGLQRVPDARSHLVSSKTLCAWLFYTTVFPYLRIQCENLFKKIREKETDGSLNIYKDSVKNIALFYKKIYPSLHFLWESTVLIYYMIYAVKKSDYHSPLLQITKTKLISCLDEFFEHSWEDKVLPNYNRAYQFLWKVLRKGVGSATLTISVGAFFLQFLEWWYGQEGGTTALCPMPIPPPPFKWPVASSSVCPICKKNRTNDSVLMCSGFVFCYPCIFKFVQEHKVCPITGYRASLDEIIKIYHQDVL